MYRLIFINRKSAFLPFHPRQSRLKSSQGGSPESQGIKVGIKKLGSFCYLTLKLHDPMVISFDALPACDGQTDRQAAYR